VALSIITKQDVRRHGTKILKKISVVLESIKAIWKIGTGNFFDINLNNKTNEK